MAGLRKVRAIIKWIIPDNLLYHYLVPIFKTVTKASEKPRKQLRFQINLTDHCNLNCAGCTAFSPIAEEKYMDVDGFERDCQRLSELTDRKIELIDLLGGEPLLHPELEKIIAIARKYFEGDINVVTNGLLLVKTPATSWITCHQNNIGIIISGYPIKLKMDEIQKLADTNNVKLVIRGSTNDIKIWNKVPYDLTGKQNQIKNFRICYGANMCINLENGRLATCPIPFVIKQFNNYFHQDIPVLETDTIDIYKVKSIEEIFDFLRRPNTQCKYCNLKGIKYGVDWSVSKRDIKEWV
ncbi:hypothetical protein AGMMS49579_25100 [Spirochaetia bacterium]|nr:hypothetical protein AGMMS49579_25100 [Spirochaetia bacterium]